MARTHSPRTGLAVGIVIGVLLLLNGLPTAEAAQGNQGLQDGWAVGDQGQIYGGQLLSDELGYMQQAGAGWVRVNFRLGACFTSWSPTVVGCNGLSALQTYDEVMANIQARNLKVLGLLTNEFWSGQQSDWTANNAENTPGGNGSNMYMTAFASNAAAVATHYNGTNGPLITQWEIWNEPNAWTMNPSPGVYSGGSFIYPSNFAQLLYSTQSDFRQANSSAMLVSGGLLGLDSGSTHRGAHNGYKPKTLTGSCPSTLPSGGDYLCSTFSMGWQFANWTKGSGPFGAIGQHLYINQSTATNSSTVQSYLNDLRTVYVSYGGEASSKQTQVTEFGWSTASVAGNVQAKNLQTAYQTFRATSYLARGYWYRTQDLGVANDYYGLVSTNGNLKPSFSAYQQHATY